MKKILILLTILLLPMTFADEIKSEQKAELVENKATISIQKQPVNANSTQTAILTKNWFVINIQINGKIQVKED